MVSTISAALSLKVWPSLVRWPALLADHGDIDAVIAEDAGEQVDVGEPRHVLEHRGSRA